MTQPSLCLFDLGDVAARFVPERRLPELSALLDSNPDTVKDRIWASGLSKRFDAGELSLQDMCEQLGQLFPRPPNPEALVRVWCLAFQPNPEVLSVAKRVSADSQIGLFTNNPPAVEKGLQRYLPEIAQTFQRRFFSSAINALKPSTEAFAAVEAATGLAGSQLALIDDSAPNVEAAKARGWQAVRFETAAKLLEDTRCRTWAAAQQSAAAVTS